MTNTLDVSSFLRKSFAYQCHEQLYRRALNYLTRASLSIGSISTGIAPLVGVLANLYSYNSKRCVLGFLGLWDSGYRCLGN